MVTLGISKSISKSTLNIEIATHVPNENSTDTPKKRIIKNILILNQHKKTPENATKYTAPTFPIKRPPPHKIKKFNNGNTRITTNKFNTYKKVKLTQLIQS